MTFFDKLLKFFNFQFKKKLKRTLNILKDNINYYVKQNCYYEATYAYQAYTNLNEYCADRNAVMDFVIGETFEILNGYLLSSECYDPKNKMMKWTLILMQLKKISPAEDYNKVLNRINLLRTISIEFNFGH